MTLAIVLAAGSTAAALPLDDGRSLTERLTDQWRRAGARDVLVAAEPAEVVRLVADADEPVVVAGADLVAHTAVLRHLLTVPGGGTVALVLTDPAVAGRAAVREDRGQVVAAGPEPDLLAATTGSFGGAVRVGVADLPALATAARNAAAGPEPAVDRLFTALTATGVVVSAHRVRLLVAHRVGDRTELAAAEAAVATVDSDKAELRLSVKERDDFFTTFFVSTWSPYVTRLAARIGLSPTGVTVISILFAVLAAGLFAAGGRAALVTGAILLYLGFVLDCVDGQLARYTRNFSAWGGWLDTMADRAKEYVVYAGLAVGVTRAGLGNGWALAVAAMTLQTVRHMIDTWYGALHDEAARRPAAAAPSGGLGARLSQASTRVQADTGSLSYWLKRIVVFPIGERWALIAVTVALFNPLVSLVAVLVWGGLAFAYTCTLRSVRARSMRVPVLTTVDAALHRDDGPLVRRFGGAGRPLPLAALAVLGAGALLGAALAGVTGTGFRFAAGGALLVVLTAGLPGPRPHAGALDWLVPASLRAAEYLFVIALGVGAGVPLPLVFVLIFVLALHHYDLTARLEKRQPAPPLHAFTLGWEGRLTVLTVGALAGFASIALTTLAVYLFVVFVVSVIVGWVVVPARAPRPPKNLVDAAGGGRSPR